MSIITLYDSTGNPQELSGDKLKGLAGLGLTGETWVDETANRELGQEYPNNTGKPIYIVVKFKNTSGTQSRIGGLIRVDDIAIGELKIPQTDDPNITVSAQCIVPNGSVYKAEGEDTLHEWFELK